MARSARRQTSPTTFATSGPAEVERFFSQMPQGLVDALPAGVCVTFDLTDGDWKRSWTVRREEDGSGHIVAKAPKACDCRLGCGVVDFIDLITGSLDPRTGFLEGRFHVEGDVGLVLRLHRCL